MHEHHSQMYSCPMHPEVVSDGPGLCSECGMALLPEKKDKKARSSKHEGSHEYNKHAGHSTNIFKVKFWVSLALTIPILLYSKMAEMFFGITAPVFSGSEYLGVILGSIIFFYGGWVFLVGAYRELQARLPGMMTLISLAVITAYVYSLYVVISGTGETLFFELSSLVTIMLLGHWIEMRAVGGAQGALRELSKLLPDTAERIRKSEIRNPKSETNSNTQNPNIETEKVPLKALQVGDWLLVKPGAKVP